MNFFYIMARSIGAWRCIVTKSIGVSLRTTEVFWRLLEQDVHKW
jgi:hypothetical protein